MKLWCWYSVSTVCHKGLWVAKPWSGLHSTGVYGECLLSNAGHRWRDEDETFCFLPLFLLLFSLNLSFIQVFLSFFFLCLIVSSLLNKVKCFCQQQRMVTWWTCNPLSCANKHYYIATWIFVSVINLLLSIILKNHWYEKETKMGGWRRICKWVERLMAAACSLRDPHEKYIF